MRDSGNNRVQTLHPEAGKRNQPVDRVAYQLFREAILKVLSDSALTHTQLVEQVTEEVKDRFTGNASWHTMTVKLDLEARGLIRRSSTRPQRYLLA
jgi:dihydroneopterin aldolase